jgi:enoyl-CoA hydratase/carnithine racemase
MQAQPIEHLRVERTGPTARIVLDRPGRYNALSSALMRELRGALTDLGGDPSVRAIILSGAGPGFSAGHDLAEMTDREPAFYAELFDDCTRLMETLHRVPQPVIAQVHGIATAAGCQLVAACDLAIAARSARFGTPGVRIGLFCSTPMVPLTRAIGRKRALEMLLTGRLIDAATARDWGLVNDVVEPEALPSATEALAARVAEASSRTIAIGKEAFYAQVDLDEPGAYELTKEVMATNALEADAREGIAAFLEKRAPVWRE